MKINLIYPPSQTPPPSLLPPLGLAILTSVLRRNGIQADQDNLIMKTLPPECGIKWNALEDAEKVRRYLIDKEKNDPLDYIAGTLLAKTNWKGCALIGFSLMSWFQFLPALILAKKIKQMEDVPIVLGGPYVTLLGHKLLTSFDFVDYGVVGNGEDSFLQLCRTLESNGSKKDIPGLVFKEGGKLITNAQAAFDINESPAPDFDGFPLEAYKRRCGYLMLPYELSRGCAYRCSFCTRPFLNKSQTKSIQKIAHELKGLSKKYKPDSFRFIADTFNTSRDYVEHFCEQLIENDVQIRWCATARLANLDEKLLKKMRRAGCFRLTFGLESGSDRILKKMGKHINLKEAEEILAISHKTGIENNICIIVGYIHETMEDFRETTDFIVRNERHLGGISISQLSVSCGSSISQHPERYGVANLRPENFYSPIYHFDEIDGLKYENKFRQQVFRKNTLHRIIEKFDKGHQKLLNG